MKHQLKTNNQIASTYLEPNEENIR